MSGTLVGHAPRPARLTHHDAIIGAQRLARVRQREAGDEALDVAVQQRLPIQIRAPQRRRGRVADDIEQRADAAIVSDVPRDVVTERDAAFRRRQAVQERERKVGHGAGGARACEMHRLARSGQEYGAEGAGRRGWAVARRCPTTLLRRHGL